MTCTIIESQPLNMADVTPAEMYKFALICADALAEGRPAPVDWEGYVNDDAVTARVQAAAAKPNPARDAAIQAAAEQAGLGA